MSLSVFSGCCFSAGLLAVTERRGALARIAWMDDLHSPHLKTREVRKGV